jgi:TPR repeat protein
MAEEQKAALHFNEIKHLLPPNYSDMEISELEKLAGQGDLEAMRNLVEKLSPQSPTCWISDSVKPTPNPEEAFKWALKLCEMGDPQGRHWLADCYFTGQFVDKADSKKAIGLLEKNAAEGDYKALERLAYYYAHGKGVKQDYGESVKWLVKMVEYGDRARSSNQTHRLPFSRNMTALGRSFCQEFSWAKEEPRYKLAELYLQGGFGIQQNFADAVIWLEKSADWGEEKYRAQFTLSKCYLTGGSGLEKNYAKAIECFEKIPEPSISLRYQSPSPWGDGYHISEEEKYRRQAQRQLGICHALGKGVEQDFAEAKKYFEKAARTSSVNMSDIPPMVVPRAEAELGICLYRLGKIADARKCFERSATKDDILGNLWLCYLDYVKNEKLRGEIDYMGMLYRTTSNPFHQPNEDEKISCEIDKAENEIDSRLRSTAVRFDTLVRKEEGINLDMLSVSDEVIQFLINRKNNLSIHPAKVILALYYQDKNNEAFLNYLEQASAHGDVIANYHLGNYYKYPDHDEAEKFLKRVTSANLAYVENNNYPLDELKELRYLAKGDLKDILYQKKLDEENKKLNGLVAMFAHNFIGTLQCIRSNAEHENNPTIHLKTVKMMGGALTALSLLSADDDKLLEQLKQDNAGEVTLQQNLANNLALAISQLLDKTNKDKIVNLYLQHLRKTKQIGIKTNSEELRINKDYRKMWQALQHQWEDEFNALFSEHVELPRLLKWVTDNFFSVEITGFDSHNISFREYGITDSIFLTVFMEIFVNAFKYMDVSKNESLTLNFCEEGQWYKLVCENPSSQETGRGTHKGMDFLKTIAKKLGGQFITEVTGNSFKSTFIVPSELLK